MRRGPRSAAFCLGFSSDALRPEYGSSHLSSRVLGGAPAPTRLGEGYHRVPAAGGTEELGLKTPEVLRLRVSVAVPQMQIELELREVD